MKPYHDWADWVPWFQGLAKKIADNGRQDFIAKSKQVDWGTENRPLLQYSDDGIDPFSFFLYLANKTRAKNRRAVYESVHKVFELTGEPLTQLREEEIIVPTVRFSLFHDRQNFQPDLLWNLFKQVVDPDKEINPEDFGNALQIKNVRLPKLTQALFIMDPQRYLPVDDNLEVISRKIFDAELDKVKKDIEESGYEEYLSAVEKVKRYFPDCKNYETNLFLFIQRSQKLIVGNEKIYQIGTHVHDDERDFWEPGEGVEPEYAFNGNSFVYTGGPGEERKFPLTEPKRGDVILVRSGTKRGRAIGIVAENEYESSGGFHKDARIHVYWINKSGADLPGFTPQMGFSRAGGATVNAFRECEAYRPSFDLIDAFGAMVEPERAPGNQPLASGEQDARTKKGGAPDRPLNTILYGPPGTGKTYATARHCVEICDGETPQSDAAIWDRYRELVKEARVEFVTFHQSYGYEEFVQGLRPKTSGGAGFRLKTRDGVLKRIADRARRNLDEAYVLVIDEINRANVSKVLGELVTLLEEDKREGAKHEIAVTLPHSGDRFTLPENLHILGTMNTADRSIALLDTALRRRFSFEEVPPKPELLEAAKEATGIDLPKVLSTINDRLEWFLDRNHLIGHAWLMSARTKADVDRIMHDKIVPLIAEYFHNDRNKVRAVLGGSDDFVPRESLSPPPGVEDDRGEDRYRWPPTPKSFADGAYDRLVAGPSSGGEESGEN